MYHSVWPCQLANFITAQPRMNSTYWHLSVCNRIVSIQHYGEMVFVLFPNNYNLVGTSHSLIYILVKFWLVCICNSIVFLFRFTLLRCRSLSLHRRRDRQQIGFGVNFGTCCYSPKTAFIYQFLRHGWRLICFPKLFKAARAWQRTGSSVRE